MLEPISRGDDGVIDELEVRVSALEEVLEVAPGDAVQLPAVAAGAPAECVGCGVFLCPGSTLCSACGHDTIATEKPLAERRDVRSLTIIRPADDEDDSAWVALCKALRCWGGSRIKIAALPGDACAALKRRVESLGLRARRSMSRGAYDRINWFLVVLFSAGVWLSPVARFVALGALAGSALLGVVLYVGGSPEPLESLHLPELSAWPASHPLLRETAAVLSLRPPDDIGRPVREALRCLSEIAVGQRQTVSFDVELIAVEAEIVGAFLARQARAAVALAPEGSPSTRRRARIVGRIERAARLITRLRDLAVATP